MYGGAGSSARAHPGVLDIAVVQEAALDDGAQLRRGEHLVQLVDALDEGQAPAHLRGRGRRGRVQACLCACACCVCMPACARACVRACVSAHAKRMRPCVHAARTHAGARAPVRVPLPPPTDLKVEVARAAGLLLRALHRSTRQPRGHWGCGGGERAPLQAALYVPCL